MDHQCAPQTTRAAPDLRHREVHVRPLLFRETDVLDTADDADDRQPLAIAGCLDAFADRITRRPVTTRERLIDDRDKWRVAVIRMSENRDPAKAEFPTPETFPASRSAVQPVLICETLPPSGGSCPSTMNPSTLPPSANGRLVVRPTALMPGELRSRSIAAVVKAQRLLFVVVLCARQSRDHRQRVFRIEAEID